MEKTAADEATWLRGVLGAMPGGIFVVDGMGMVSFASRVAADTVAATPEEVVGTSVLQWVSEDTAWAYAAAIAMADDYADVIIGPLRVTLRTQDGRDRYADLWAENHLEDPEIAGIVCLLTAETAAVWLGDAIESLAKGADRAEVAAHVVTAMRGHPVTSDAVLLDLSGPEPAILGATTVPHELVAGTEGPWWRAEASGVRSLDADLSTLSEPARAAAEAAGYRAVWAEPVPTDDGSSVVLVLWRRSGGNPSPNELNSMFQGASILSLAWRVHALD